MLIESLISNNYKLYLINPIQILLCIRIKYSILGIKDHIVKTNMIFNFITHLAFSIKLIVISHL